MAREILSQLQITNPEETDMICGAIQNHSAKENRHDAFGEVLIDADIMQRYLHNVTAPVMEREKSRLQQLMQEFGLVCEA